MFMWLIFTTVDGLEHEKLETLSSIFLLQNGGSLQHSFKKYANARNTPAAVAVNGKRKILLLVCFKVLSYLHKILFSTPETGKPVKGNAENKTGNFDFAD